MGHSGRIAPTEELDKLQDALAAFLRDPQADPEDTHQIRVSSGRLVAWLEMTPGGDGRRRLRRELRRMRRAAGHVRDLDVSLALARRLGEDPGEVERGAAAFEAWGAPLRNREAATLAEHLARPEVGELLDAVSQRDPLSRTRARKRADVLTRRVERRREEVIASEGTIESLHGLRRALRRLRYVLAWQGGPTRLLRHWQEHFGDLNDLATALRLCEDTPPDAGLDALRALWKDALETSRVTAYEASVDARWEE